MPNERAARVVGALAVWLLLAGLIEPLIGAFEKCFLGLPEQLAADFGELLGQLLSGFLELGDLRFECPFTFGLAGLEASGFGSGFLTLANSGFQRSFQARDGLAAFFSRREISDRAPEFVESLIALRTHAR